MCSGDRAKRNELALTSAFARQTGVHSPLLNRAVNSGGAFLIVDLGDEDVGRQHQTGDAGRILQSRTGDLGRIDNTGLEHVNVLTAIGIIPNRCGFFAALTNLVGNDRSVDARIGRQRANRFLEGTRDDFGAQFFVGLEPLGQSRNHGNGAA